MFSALQLIGVDKTYLESQPFWFFKQNVLKLDDWQEYIGMAARKHNITKVNEVKER